MIDDEPETMDSMANRLFEFLQDAADEKRTIGYVDADIRKMLLAWQAELEQAATQAAEVSDSRHRFNRDVIAADVGDRVPLLTPDGSPLVMEHLRCQAWLKSALEQIGEVLREPAEHSGD